MATLKMNHFRACERAKNRSAQAEKSYLFVLRINIVINQKRCTLREPWHTILRVYILIGIINRKSCEICADSNNRQSFFVCSTNKCTETNIHTRTLSTQQTLLHSNSKANRR